MKKNLNDIQIENIRSIERLEQCIEILIEAYNGEPWYDVWTYDTAKALLRCCFETPNFHGWIAMSGEKVVGCCIGNSEPFHSGSNYYLKYLFVSVKAQKSGIGNKLLATMKTDLQNSEVTTIILFTQKPMADFYSRSGFAEMKGLTVMTHTS